MSNRHMIRGVGVQTTTMIELDEKASHYCINAHVASQSIPTLHYIYHT